MTNQLNTEDTPVADPDAASPGFVLTEPAQGRRVLSGIQPSGTLHLGNYFGALVQHIQAQHRNDCLFFIADYHAMTTVRDGAALRHASHDVAMDYLALGLDPSKVALYRQHDLPLVTSLAWILSCICPVGDLERSVSFKDKVAKGLGASAGLLNYPLLMAADILMVNAEVVPVGQDQLQNIELARRMASRFNEAYGVELFTLPMAQINEAKVVPGLDGAKMSKSYGNTIPIFASDDDYRRLVATIKTDSLPATAAKDPRSCNVYALMQLMASRDELAEWARRYRAGGLRYSSAKGRLLELLLQHFGPAMARRQELLARPWEVEEVLRAGAMKAARLAQPVIDRVFTLVGLDTSCLSPLSSVSHHRHAQERQSKGWGS